MNVPPTAVATATCSEVTCSFDGSASSDPDGHVVSYAWTFGDTATGTGATTTHTYTAPGSYSVTLTVTDNAGATATDTITVNPTRSSFTAITPCRAFDTRTGHGSCTSAPATAKAPVGAGGTLAVKLTGVAGIPSTATSVVLNVTAVNATSPTYVTVYPAGATRPLASDLNVTGAKATPNLVIVPVGAGGVVDFYNNAGKVDLLADVSGYFSPTSAAQFTAIAPCRLFDTRLGAGGCANATAVAATPVLAGATLTVPVAGTATIPSNATAVVLNVTAVSATSDTYVTVYPDGATRPVASNLNVHSAAAVPNLVVVPIGADGSVDFYNNTGTVNVIADVAGYFAPGTGAGYTSAGPCRVFDTRVGTGSCTGAVPVTAAPLAPGATLVVQAAGVAGVPADATAVVLNVTAVGATSPSFITVFPDGSALPGVSNLNVTSPAAIPNLVIVPVGAGGKIDFYNQKGSVNVIADIAGYFAP